MKRDAEIVTSFKPPKFLTPNVIVDLGLRTFYSTQAFISRYPKATIISGQSERANFLLDKNALAYHDNVIFKNIDLSDFDLDYFIEENLGYNQQIDFLKIDLSGKEKNIIKSAGVWPDLVNYLKIKLYDYDYEEAKRDLKNLGFKSWATYDGNYYVIGENPNSPYV